MTNQINLQTIIKIEKTLKEKYKNQKATTEQIQASAIEELEKTNTDYKIYCSFGRLATGNCCEHSCGLAAELAYNVKKQI